MAPTGQRSERFSVKFYLVGMIFILFDIEAVFLYPWAVVFRELKMFALLRKCCVRRAGPGRVLLRVEEGRAGLVARGRSRGPSEPRCAILETIEAFGETTLIVDPARIVELAAYLKTRKVHPSERHHRRRLASGRSALRSGLPSAFDRDSISGCA